MDYEILSPWGEIETIPPKALQPRVKDLSGKTIGLFAFFKQHGSLIMKEVERQLKDRFPSAKYSHFKYPRHVAEIVEDEEFKTSFQEWLKGVDTVISGNGD